MRIPTYENGMIEETGLQKGTCIPRNVHHETETTSDRRKRAEHYILFFLSLCLSCGPPFLFLAVRVASLPIPPSPHLPQQADLLSCRPISFAASFSRRREISEDEDAEQKSDRVQVQGQILKRIFKQKLGFFDGTDRRPPFYPADEYLVILRVSLIFLYQSIVIYIYFH